MKRFDCPRRVGRWARRFRADYGDGGSLRGGQLIDGIPNQRPGRGKAGWSRRRPTGNLLEGTFQKRFQADELFGRHLVAPMHLDQTTDEAELTEVASVGSCSAAALILAAARTRVRACVVVMVQSGRSIPKTLSARIDFLFLDAWKRSCNTADPPSGVTLSF